jgi:predicted nucleotidyltransferase
MEHGGRVDPVNRIHITPDNELNWVLRELVSSIQSILGENFIGAYLQGSFALGDWDFFSDVDFITAIEHEVSAAELEALQAMHARIYRLESHWAMHLEGSYIPREILRRKEFPRRTDPARTPLQYLDNTFSYLVPSDHDNTLVVRWVTREHGITLAGPDPKTLIDPVPPDDLCQEVLAILRNWAEQIFADPAQINNRFYQPYAVLSYCRMLYTQHTGTVSSKPAAARWAQETLNSRWRDLIQRARDERAYPSLRVRQPADAEDLKRTLEFIAYALEVSQEWTRMPVQTAGAI